ncbi:uncharacterized protein LOC121999416 [Zingiber officinale]|uniref:uncharacterized protein LOC121999416 n=1 Tax=Zingiber officinale TaxID=94328 RepID=UPI001C4D8AE5|nr:uncharacterized protein LOC121999416 [Zingiber officinale]
MSPPRNLKEAQRLTGRIIALSRFILKTTDQSLPFFKILRRATKFQWDAECDKAFEELKVYLNSLPVLAKSVVGEALRVYLSSTEYVVGSALVRSNGEEQLVYFLSHILKDAESRYTGLKKLAFALVLAARRLRPYFLAHPIVVMTNSPLGRLDYRVTNNEAKYEALIAGLQAARHVVASKVFIHSDSQLAAQQLSGAFEISNVRLKLYAGAFEKLKSIELVSLVVHIDRMEGLTFPNDWRTAIAEFLKSGGELVGSSSLATSSTKKRSPGLCSNVLVRRMWTIFCKRYTKAHAAGIQAEDATRTVAMCLSCQKYHNFSHRPTEELKTSTVSCPFDQWGMDIVGSFPMAIGQRKFLLVVVDYFSKWVEAKPLAKITEQMVKKFIWQHIICQFGIPRWLMSDNGRQFIGQQLREWCEGYGI